MQVGAVVVPIGGVVLALAEVAQRGQADHAAVLPAAAYLVQGLGVDLLKGGAQPEPEQDTAGVRRGLDARADLSQLGGLFQNRDTQAALPQ